MKKKSSAPQESPLPVPLAQSVVSTAKAINKIAMLCRLAVSCFIGNPQDKNLTSEVASTHGVAGQKRISVRKRIMQGEELNEVISSAGKLRITHARLSRPWFDGGTRAIPAANFFSVKTELDGLIEDFRNAVARFLSAYDSIIARDRIELNGTFDSGDYPSREELAGKFGVYVEYMPIPTKNDFRVEGLSEETLAQLQADMEKGILARMKAGDCELLERLKNEVSHLVNRLTVPSADGEFRFKQNSLDNIKQAATDVAALNIGDNAAISNICDKLSTAFDMDADLLRENEASREEKAKEAKARLAEIEKVMQGYIS